jgi:predicted TIM-barrel fold metal-dependent hydrolase
MFLARSPIVQKGSSPILHRQVFASNPKKDMKKYQVIFSAVAALVFLTSCNNKPVAKHYTGEIVDIHNHVSFDDELGTTSDVYKGTPEEIIDLTKTTPIKKHGIITMARKGQLERTRKNNDRIIQLAKNNAQFIPICSIHPDDGDSAIVEMERVARLGVRFLKLHPYSQHFEVSTANVGNVVKKAGELKLIILFEGTFLFDADILGKYILLAATNPGTKFILTHMGGNEFTQYQVFMFLNRYSWYKRNIWVDIAATISEFAESPYKENLIWTMEKVGTDRILFGSDFPLYNPANALESFYKLGLPDTTEKQILHDNFYNLLELK